MKGQNIGRFVYKGNHFQRLRAVCLPYKRKWTVDKIVRTIILDILIILVSKASNVHILKIFTFSFSVKK